MNQNRHRKEFIAMVALLMSMGALSIDAILPAMGNLSQDLEIPLQSRFWVISILITGMAVGQIFYGPWSDQVGRRQPMIWGIGIFLLGSGMTFWSTTFEILLLGRFLQGIGAASPRVITTAIIRDSYEGRGMAQIMSFTMSVFILMPILAPTIGQGILLIGSWRWIFAFIFLMALIALTWFYIMQEESLPLEKRIPLRLKSLMQGAREVASNPQAISYTLTSGIIFGGFLGYLNSAQYIFQEIYQVGDLFGVYFGVLAIAFGSAFIINGKWVMHYGMVFISKIAVMGHFVSSGLFLVNLYFNDYHLSLWVMLAFFVPIFFFIALIFGNMQALAMVPMGHIAGIASSIIGSVSTLVAVPIGSWIGSHLESNLFGIGWGFSLTALLGCAIIFWIAPSTIETSTKESANAH